MSGKDDDPRPLSVPEEEYAESWKRIFRKHRDKRLRLPDDLELTPEDDDEAG